MSLSSKDSHELDVLRELEAEPQVSQRQLSDRIDLSLGRTNYVLKALVEKGWVKVENFSKSPNKLGYMYLLTPKGVEEKVLLTQRFLARKYAEYNAITEEIARLEAELAKDGHKKGDTPSVSNARCL